MAKILLASSIVMGLSYATLELMSWTSGDPAEKSLVVAYFTGTYAWLYWLLLACNVVAPQSLWFPKARRSLPWLLLIAVVVNIGMWLERLMIIWGTLSHGYATSMWRAFSPTFWDASLLLAPFGPFVLLFLIAVRLIPPVAMSDTRELAHREIPT
jgi:molybdopterin-containing oxidoreductase family membrane subunit